MTRLASRLALPIAVLAVVVATAISSALAQEQPPFIDPATNQIVPANQTACLSKLGWPKCFGWNLANDTLKDDPGFKKYEVQACTAECKLFKSSLSRDYVERICGPKPVLPNHIDLDRLAFQRLQSQLACAKDESGTNCMAVMQEVFEKAKFNESHHMGAGGQVPWPVIPKDYACSKCMTEQLLIESQLAEWHKTTMNVNWPGTLDRTEGGLQQRADLCKGWTTPSSESANGQAKPAAGQPSSAQVPVSSALTTLALIGMIGCSLMFV